MKTWAVKDLVAATNADWNDTIPLGIDDQVWDPTGGSAEMRLRFRPQDPDAALTLATGSGLTLSADPRSVTVAVDAAQMAQLAAATYHYDVIVTTTTPATIRAAVGTVLIHRGVTRP